MTSDRLRVGIAGFGVVGERRRRFIDQHPGLKTIAVCDQKFAAGDSFGDGVVCVPTYQALLEQPLDVLFVCLPNYLAPDVTIAGLERGLHVFCEKPPGRTVEDVERVIAVERERPSLRLKYGFNHRYHGSVQDALTMIRDGKLGSIVNLRGVYGKSKIIPFSGGWRAERALAGGGILLDQGIHMVDLMGLFCGEFVEIKSFVSNSYWEHDVEDNAYALLRDATGRVAMLHSSATQWQHRFSLDISLTEGYLQLRGILSGSKSYGEEKLIIGPRDDESETGAQREQTIVYLEDPSWRDEIHDFARAIIDDTEIETGTSAEALATMKLVYGIYRADPEWRESMGL